MFFRLQNSPYFCIFEYVRAVKQKVRNDAENVERETLTSLFTDIFTHFEKKKTDCFTVYMFFKVFLSLYIHVRFYLPKRGCPTARKEGIQVLDSGFSTVDSGFQVLGS